MKILHEQGINIQNVSRETCRKAAVTLTNNRLTISAAAIFIGCSVSTVSRSIKRMSEVGNLIDLPRSGCPATYSPAFNLELTGFYCQTQPLPSSGRWTLRWAADHLKSNHEILNASPSKSTIHRILKKNNLKPHQSRYFLHITDPNFFPKMDHLINLYLHPPKNLFFFDECPGIQILKRLVPNIRTDKTMKRLEEFEYIRNGTMNVLAFFNNANGKVYAECQADHKTDTFLKIFKTHVASCPDKEKIHYVMDNLSTHRGYPFCKTVAELSGMTCPPESHLNNLQKRVAWLKSTGKRIIIHFTPYHGSWLNLVEFWFGIMNKKVLNDSYGSVIELKEAFEAFLKEWNTLLAHPFNWTYNGNGLHEKAVNRFATILKHSAGKLEISSLTKQLKLMHNLFNTDFDKVPVGNWEYLFKIFQSQEKILRNNIMNEKGPKKKEKAEQAMNSFLAVLRNYIQQDKKLVA